MFTPKVMTAKELQYASIDIARQHLACRAKMFADNPVQENENALLQAISDIKAIAEHSKEGPFYTEAVPADITSIDVTPGTLTDPAKLYCYNRGVYQFATHWAGASYTQIDNYLKTHGFVFQSVNENTGVVTYKRKK